LAKSAVEPVSVPGSTWWPTNFERAFGYQSCKHGQSERSDFVDELRQVASFFTEPAPAGESSPLHSSCRIIPIGIRKPNRLGFDCCSPVAERGADPPAPDALRAGVYAGEEGEIVEIFHSAVEEAKNGKRLQLLGNDGFLWICAEHGAGK
jgi:hypothetical protein